MIEQFLHENIKLDTSVNPPNSKSFKKWFGKSKVIDKKGNPKVMYHGTSAKFHTFRTTSELGIHVGDLEAARTINNYKSGSLIMSLYVRSEKPLRMEDILVFDPQDIIPALVEHNKIPQDVTDRLQYQYKQLLDIELDSAKAIKRSEREELRLMENIQDEIKGLGFDSIVYKNQREGNADSYILFDANQVKSIYNKGTWSINKDNIND